MELTLVDKIPNYQHYEIDVSRLDPGKTAIFFKTAPGEENTTVRWLNLR